MATLTEALETTDADQFADSSKQFITELAATPKQAAKVTFATDTLEKEQDSLRKAARAAGFTLSKIRNTPIVVNADGTTTLSLKLGPLVIIPEGTPRPNRKKASDAPAEADTVSAP